MRSTPERLTPCASPSPTIARRRRIPGRPRLGASAWTRSRSRTSLCEIASSTARSSARSLRTPGEVDKGADGAGDGEAAPGAQVVWFARQHAVKPNTGLLPEVCGARHLHLASLLLAHGPPPAGRCEAEGGIGTAGENGGPLPRALWAAAVAQQVNRSVKGMEPAALSAVPDRIMSESAGTQLPVADHAALASRDPRGGRISQPHNPRSLDSDALRRTASMPQGSGTPGLEVVRGRSSKSTKRGLCRGHGPKLNDVPRPRKPGDARVTLPLPRCYGPAQERTKGEAAGGAQSRS